MRGAPMIFTLKRPLSNPNFLKIDPFLQYRDCDQTFKNNVSEVRALTLSSAIITPTQITPTYLKDFITPGIDSFSQFSRFGKSKKVDAVKNKKMMGKKISQLNQLFFNARISRKIMEKHLQLAYIEVSLVEWHKFTFSSLARFDQLGANLGLDDVRISQVAHA